MRSPLREQRDVLSIYIRVDPRNLCSDRNPRSLCHTQARRVVSTRADCRFATTRAPSHCQALPLLTQRATGYGTCRGARFFLNRSNSPESARRKNFRKRLGQRSSPSHLRSFRARHICSKNQSRIQREGSLPSTPTQPLGLVFSTELDSLHCTSTVHFPLANSIVNKLQTDQKPTGLFPANSSVFNERFTESHRPEGPALPRRSAVRSSFELLAHRPLPSAVCARMRRPLPPHFYNPSFTNNQATTPT
jgi:hypothetical protein